MTDECLMGFLQPLRSQPCSSSQRALGFTSGCAHGGCRDLERRGLRPHLLHPSTPSRLVRRRGCSAAAGIPTGYDMIVDFKTRLFCRGHQPPRREPMPEILCGSSGSASTSTRSEGCLPTAIPVSTPPSLKPSIRIIGSAHLHRRANSPRRSLLRASGLGGLCGESPVPAIFTSNFDRLIENSSTEADALLEPKDQARLATSDLNAVDVADAVSPRAHGPFWSNSMVTTSPKG